MRIHNWTFKSIIRYTDGMSCIVYHGNLADMKANKANQIADVATYRTFPYGGTIVRGGTAI